MRGWTSGIRLRTAGAGLFLAALFVYTVNSSAQKDLFITVSAPNDRTPAAPVPSSEIPFITVSTPAQEAPAVVIPAAPAENPSAETRPVPPSAEPSIQQESPLLNFYKLEQELLRDPFWPVGFFPPDWKKSPEPDGGVRKDEVETGWNAAAAKIRVGGTSQMAGRTVAVVNGALKGPGDQIQVAHEGKIYRWRILRIEPDGRIPLERDGVE